MVLSYKEHEDRDSYAAIRQWREARGYRNQKELAAVVGVLGGIRAPSYATISRLESGEDKIPNPDIIELIAKAMCCSVDELRKPPPPNIRPFAFISRLEKDYPIPSERLKLIGLILETLNEPMSAAEPEVSRAFAPIIRGWGDLERRLAALERAGSMREISDEVRTVMGDAPDLQASPRPDPLATNALDRGAVGQRARAAKPRRGGGR